MSKPNVQPFSFSHSPEIARAAGQLFGSYPDLEEKHPGQNHRFGSGFPRAWFHVLRERMTTDFNPFILNRFYLVTGIGTICSAHITGEGLPKDIKGLEINYWSVDKEIGYQRGVAGELVRRACEIRKTNESLSDCAVLGPATSGESASSTYGPEALERLREHQENRVTESIMALIPVDGAENAVLAEFMKPVGEPTTISTVGDDRFGIAEEIRLVQVYTLEDLPTPHNVAI